MEKWKPSQEIYKPRGRRGCENEMDTDETRAKISPERIDSIPSIPSPIKETQKLYIPRARRKSDNQDNVSIESIPKPTKAVYIPIGKRQHNNEVQKTTNTMSTPSPTKQLGISKFDEGRVLEATDFPASFSTPELQESIKEGRYTIKWYSYCFIAYLLQDRRYSCLIGVSKSERL
jgi:hypothetical protein